MNILQSVFLPMNSMKTKYPYLNKAPFLLPIAWLGRIVHYIFETKKNTADDMIESFQIGKNRIQLMKKYNVISKKT